MEHTVLVVEDEKGIRESLKLFLKSHNYEVVEAENGAEALKKISPDIHLAIVDIMMPVMDGITFVSRLRESYDFPVIFLSAKDEDIDKITGLNIGAENLQAAESRIRDTNMASEMVEFTKDQVLSQAGTAMLAQANQSSQNVLSLLR